MGKPTLYVTFNFVSPFDPKRRFTRTCYGSEKAKLLDSIIRINNMKDRNTKYVYPFMFRDHKQYKTNAVSKSSSQKPKKEIPIQPEPQIENENALNKEKIDNNECSKDIPFDDVLNKIFETNPGQQQEDTLNDFNFWENPATFADDECF